MEGMFSLVNPEHFIVTHLRSFHSLYAIQSLSVVETANSRMCLISSWKKVDDLFYYKIYSVCNNMDYPCSKCNWNFTDRDMNA